MLCIITHPSISMRIIFRNITRQNGLLISTALHDRLRVARNRTIFLLKFYFPTSDA